MRTLKYTLALCAISYAGLIFAGTPTTMKTQQTASVLFTQLARSATITPLKKANWYHFTLNNVASNTAWFTDRPARRHGTLTTQKFVQFWHKGQNSFANNPPNANLVFLSTTTRGLTQTNEHIVELTTPHYSPATHQLSYNIEALPPIHKVMPGKTKEVALFIDSADFDVGCIDIFKCL